jgi:hypothetical protein
MKIKMLLNLGKDLPPFEQNQVYELLDAQGQDYVRRGWAVEAPADAPTDGHWLGIRFREGSLPTNAK